MCVWSFYKFYKCNNVKIWAQRAEIGRNRFVIWEPKWSHDLQHSILALTKLDRQPLSLNPIKWLVMSSSSSYMIVPTVFFKLLLWLTSTQPYFILKVVTKGKLCWDSNIWNHLNVCIQMSSHLKIKFPTNYSFIKHKYKTGFGIKQLKKCQYTIKVNNQNLLRYSVMVTQGIIRQWAWLEKPL